MERVQGQKLNKKFSRVICVKFLDFTVIGIDVSDSIEMLLFHELHVSYLSVIPSTDTRSI